MSWQAVVIKRDKGFMSMGERPLAEHLKDKLNEIEDREGPITDYIEVTDTEHLVEIVVQVEPRKLLSGIQD